MQLIYYLAEYRFTSLHHFINFLHLPLKKSFIYLAHDIQNGVFFVSLKQKAQITVFHSGKSNHNQLILKQRFNKHIS